MHNLVLLYGILIQIRQMFECNNGKACEINQSLLRHYCFYVVNSSGVLIIGNID